MYIDGSYSYSNIVEVDIKPNEYKLLQNYPNPFNPSTSIEFAIPFDGFVKLNLYNVNGE